MKKYLIIIGFFALQTIAAQETVSLNTVVTGTKEYKAQKTVFLKPGFSYSATGNNTFRAWIDFFTNPYPNDITGGPTSSSNGIVGSVEGNFNVSPSGAATYEVPIKLPPGTGGMTPELSIVYNSQSGDGYLGMGFSINGLSEIARVPGKSFLEGYSGYSTLRFDETDKFALDGQQLMCFSLYYGTLDSEFRTENNEFSRIKSIGGSNYLPQSFKVWTKSGLIYEYGTTENSRVKLSDGKIVRWLLYKVTDTKGNYFTITYDNDSGNGAYYPLRIDYTGNNSVNPVLQPYCSVRFFYVSRPTTNLGYVLGNKTQITKQLSQIKAYYEQTVVKTYDFQYNSYNNLKSIQEIGKDDTKYNPTSFEWYTHGSFKPPKEYYIGDDFIGCSQKDITIADFNGDGKSEILAYPKPGATWQLRVFSLTSKADSFHLTGTGSTLTGLKKIYAGDFNGDGKADIIQCCSTNGTKYEYFLGYSDGTFFTMASSAFFTTERANHEIRIGDFTGNGVSDFIVFYKEKKFENPDYEVYSFNYVGSNPPYTRTYGNLPSGINWDKIETGDFNGDGLMDIINWHSGGYLLGITNGDGPMRSVTKETWPQKAHHVTLGDFNGDGKTDMLVTGYNDAPWSQWQMYHGNGTGFVKVGDILRKFDSNLKQIFVCDINGDGRDDFFAVDKTASSTTPYYMYFSDETGANFSSPSTGYYVYPTSTWQFYTGDFNGDGRADILGHTYWLIVTPSEPHGLLQSITDGLGYKQKIEYRKMTDNTVYQNAGTNPTYPLSTFRAPLNLVYETKSSDGIGGWVTTRYKYAGARVHKKGKGMLGFTEFTVTDVLTNTITTSTFEIEPKRFATALKKTETKVGSKLINSTEYINKLKTYDNTTESYHTIYTYSPVKVTSKNYELAPTATTPYQTTITRYQYDSYGNIDRTSIRYSDTDSVVNVNVYTNTNATDKWHLGRLTSATVTKYNGTQTTVSQSEFAYDPASGLLVKETVQPADSLGYTKSYKHDAFGNITRSMTKGIKGNHQNNHRSQKTTYDSKGRFIIDTYNSLDHKESQETDPYLGTTVTKTSPNVLTTSYRSDGFGQTMGGTSPDGNHTVTHILWNKGHTDAPARAVYYTYSESSGSPPVLVFYDTLRRELRQIATGFNGTLIYKDTEYNNKGQVYRVSEPYFKGGTPLWTVHAYDGMGRITQYTLPDGKTIKTAYDGFTTTVTNQLGQNEKKTIDAQGRLKVSEDNIGGKVTYTYNANGNVTKVAGPGTTINMVYNGMGNLIRMEDPDLGNIAYRYNIFGETTSRKHLGKTLPATTFEYDSLSRMIKRVEPEGTTTWVYDTKKIGMLTSVTHSVSGAGQEYEYDQWCRVTTVKEKISTTESYQTTTTYDRYGRTDQLTYPNNALTVTHVYNERGYLQQVKNAGTGLVYWTAQQMNARGQLEQFLLGNGLQTTRTYKTETGHLETIKALKTGGAYIQNWSYTFDAVGNMKQRKDVARNKWEDFEYDNLNRLRFVRQNGTVTCETDYDAAGNMTKKTDLGDNTFQYLNGSNKLASITAKNSTTDINNHGAGKQRIAYSSFDKVRTIGFRNGAIHDSLQIDYGTAHQRVRATTFNAQGMTVQRTYVGALYEKEFIAVNSETKHIYYIFAGGGAVAIYTESNKTSAETVYLHKDHLGSIAAISDAAGALKQELSYDAWGNRRDPVTWKIKEVIPLFARGFTGHEHLDLFALVNMNGRMYDPVIGRFLSPDPYMQAPDFTQGLNRYIYCLNNPLSLTDPSGYSWLSRNWKSLLASAVAITVSVVTAGAGTGFGYAILAGAAGGFAGSATGALLNGANIGQIMKAGAIGAFWGAAGSAVSFGVGELKFDDIIGKMLAHGVSQGATTAAQGGKFQHGFFSAAFTAGLAPGIKNSAKSTFGKVLASSIVGGTASTLGGGKFANGAITGAYVMLFNHMQHDGDEDSKKGETSSNVGEAAGEIVGKADLSINTIADDLPKVRGVKFFGKGLGYGSIILDGLDVYDQLQSGKGVHPVTATGFGAGFIGAIAEGLSKIGIGGRITPFIGSVTGWIGTTIAVPQTWWNIIYKPMNDLQYAPLYYDKHGVPYYGDPDY